VVLCCALVGGAPFGESILYRTAVSTSIGPVVATLGAAALVHKTAGAVVAPLTLVRVLSALVGAIAAARSLPQGGKLVTIAECMFVVGIYVALLALLREIGTRDAATLRQILGKKA